MDNSNLRSRASRASSFFNSLATTVLVLGVLFAIGAFIKGMKMADSAVDGIIYGVMWVLGAALFVAVVWSAIKVSSLIAGYISVRLGNGSD